MKEYINHNTHVQYNEPTQLSPGSWNVLTKMFHVLKDNGVRRGDLSEIVEAKSLGNRKY